MTPERYARLRSVLERRQLDLTVLIENVHKPHNVSAIIRTADAVGLFELHAVSPTPFRPRHMSSGGAGRYLRVRSHHSLDQAVGVLRQQGLRLVAAHPSPAATAFRAVDYTRPTAILLGAEKEGLSPAAAAAADAHVSIPMMGAVPSLNVSVAAAVILYEAQRQRHAAGFYDRVQLDAETRRRTLFEWTHPRIAALCRRRGVPYPELGPDGEIRGEVPRG